MSTELRACLRRCTGGLLTVAVLSGGSNILALTGSIFMLAVYDRVIPSGSVTTLVVLTVLCTLAYGLQGFVDILRGRILTRTGLVVKESVSPRILDITVRNASGLEYRANTGQRDLDQVANFVSSMGPTALFDLPWLPVYLCTCFAFHFYMGAIVTAGAVVLAAVTLIGNHLSRRPSEELSRTAGLQSTFLGASQSQAETLHAMGMTLNLSSRWLALGSRAGRATEVLGDITTNLGTLSRALRMLLQSLVLAVGAFLVIHGDATGGIMIASSILSARALAPIELIIGHWKGLLGARQSWQRLEMLLKENPPEPQRFRAPSPTADLQCEGLSVALSLSDRPLLNNVSFRLVAGDALAIVGPTGSGKSTLARALVGLSPPTSGAVRLDGLSISDWSVADRGTFVGYLPQSSSLFDGTIAENIARFDPDARDEDIVSVAKLAGVHQLVARLPSGYSTKIATDGRGLSGGQVQRIGLARALYGEPFLVVLDEPNSNLDSDGDIALTEAIAQVRARGGIVVVVTHRTRVLAAMTHMLVLRDGLVEHCGQRDEVLKLLQARPPAADIAA